MAGNAELLQRGAPDALAGELAAASSDGVRIEPLPFRSVVNLRGPATEEFANAVENATGTVLPLEPNRWTGDGNRAVFWLGPDEWLLVAPDGKAKTIEEAVRAARPDESWLSIVDVSHNYTCLLLSGPCVRYLLAKGCPLDLHPRTFGPGDCAQTILAKSRVFLRALDDVNSFELWIRNSFARYTVRWLLDACAEFRGAQAARR